MSTMAEVLVTLETSEKLALVPLLVDVEDSEAQPPSYHILSELYRQNVTNASTGQIGIPITFSVDFVDYSTCERLAGAWVDYWSANATGIYSGFVQASASSSAAGGAGGGGGQGSSGSMTSSSTQAGSARGSSAPPPSMPSSNGTSLGNSTDMTSSSSRASGSGGGQKKVATDNLTFNRGVY